MSERAAGILMPISSLPSEYGIGCFSKSAYEFVDWLKGAGQSYWQILPLGPTSYGDSPYQSFSTFAGNPYFISLDELIEEGVLTRAECEKVNWGKAKGSIDYEKIYNGRYPLLRKAYGQCEVNMAPGKLSLGVGCRSVRGLEVLPQPKFRSTKPRPRFIGWKRSTGGLSSTWAQRIWPVARSET